MKKIMITGFSGFVGRHFLDYLESRDETVEVMGVDLAVPHDLSAREFGCVKLQSQALNLLDKDALQKVVGAFQPDQILHLASFSSVAYSWQNPVESFQNNINIFLNLTESIRHAGLKCRLLSIGSSEEYGNINSENLPLKEDAYLDPVSPYAVARVSQELLSRVYVGGFGLDIVMTRSFNHFGPNQNERFVIPSFVQQLVNIKLNRGTGELVVGDVSIIRDFSDVRDVVKAYYLLLNEGRSGEIYNVCSGKGYSLEEIIKIITRELDIQIDIKVDPQRVRPSDNKIIIGSNEKIKRDLNWVPQYSIDTTIRDVIKEWKEKLSDRGGHAGSNL